MSGVERGRRSGDLTRDRILNAAIARFAAHSYDAIGLRDVARDAGVDVAYVHRCFGSKERLFADCVRATLRLEPALAAGQGDPADNLAKLVLHAHRDIGALDIFIQSCSSPTAARVLKEIAPEVISLVSREFGGLSPVRTTLALALLTGVGILKNVIGVAPIADADEQDLTRLISDVLKHILRSGDVQA